MLKRFALSAVLTAALSTATLSGQVESPAAYQHEAVMAAYSDAPWYAKVDIAGQLGTLPYREAVYTVDYDMPVVQVPEIVEPELTMYDEQQIRCLTDNLYFEARGEPRRGQIAVVDVVFNRAESAKFPDTPCEVVYQRNRRGCQFSWTCDRHPDRVRNRELYENLEELVTDLYVEREEAQVTRGATYYHANYVKPRWSRVFARTATYGNHIFYRE